MPPESILSEAQRIIYGARSESYGPPLENHVAIANLWQAFLDNKAIHAPGRLTPQEAAAMMVLLKVARLQHDMGHRDSLVDSAGYLACIDRMNAAERAG